MDGAGLWIAFAAGLLIVLSTFSSVVKTLIVPRGASSMLTQVVSGTIVGGFHAVADRVPSWDRRDRILAVLGPSLLLGALAAWLLLLFIGFGLMAWPFDANSLGDALRLSGSSMGTLGFAVPRDAAPTAIAFLAAAAGLFVVALQIAYLPVLYGAFNQRELLVTMLESRAGSPPWGPELLARHQLVDIVDNLPRFYADWEEWAANLVETHTSYPSLIQFRSPSPLRHWVLALLAVMDAAALQHSLMPYTAPSETRLVLRMGYTALRGLARVMRIPADTDPHPDDPIQLSRDDFLGAVRHLKEAGWKPERPAAEAWDHFRGWRVNYEAVAYAIADAVEAAPAPWSGQRRHLGGVVIPPARPVDRRPDARQEMLAQARQRQAGRPTSGYRKLKLPPVATLDGSAVPTGEIGAAPAGPERTTGPD